MALDEFWQERENQWRKNEERCIKLFNLYRNNYSYSTSEKNTLVRLKLLTSKA